jgi:predicted RNA-binding protein with PUA-like domain
MARLLWLAKSDPEEFSFDDPRRAPKGRARWGTGSGTNAFRSPVTLETLRSLPGLEGMDLLRRGNRLSVLPVTAAHWTLIQKAGGTRR